MPSAGRTSMPMIIPAPLMSALDATLRVAGSMVTIDLPSTSPTIQPAASAPVVTKADAASAPASVSSFICLNMEVAPFMMVDMSGTTPAGARDAREQLRGRHAPDAGARDDYPRRAFTTS
jgi:hypothetical protein